MNSGKPSVYKLFLPLKPMLAGKISGMAQLASIVQSKGSVMVETKYDGERI